jgi:hypothetical protein
MKKVVISLSVLLLIALISIYILIPQKLSISEVAFSNCNESGAIRTVFNETSWRKWWPEKSTAQLIDTSSILHYKGSGFKIDNRFHNAVEIFIINNQDTVPSKLQVLNSNGDSVLLYWTAKMNAGNNPFRRIIRYRVAHDIKIKMNEILTKLSIFLQTSENIYGFKFFITISSDSTLIATSKKFSNYPSTEEIYSMIESLRRYAAMHKAKENNKPMLNVKVLENKEFETTVALPVNKKLVGKGEIFFSRFVPWKGLTADVRGGTSTVNEALRQMVFYLTDHQMMQMAVPHQSLITDRRSEPDTTKWLTRIYIPVP